MFRNMLPRSVNHTDPGLLWCL